MDRFRRQAQEATLPRSGEDRPDVKAVMTNDKKTPSS